MVKHDGHETKEELYAEAAAGNADAFRFLKDVIQIAHVWDDLIDKDKAVTDSDVHSAFTAALITLPANPFYARFRSILDSALLLAIINWRAATNAEREGGEPWTFILRSSYADLIVLTRMLTSGLEEAVAFAAKVRAAAHHEQFEGYLAALERERQTREG